ncbi:Protein containing ALS2cr12 (ALS2CR12) signature [Caenorhabditis elegans]|uniref:Protein containing ALS2cr12 (ALS2CR12) signature n=1 Tax=Caenorhabditis elegans TaxID=6239 RepID=H2KZX5_CAEEL|nr:Protein containing ALS2cr12 (ALS2CR12) signature [Caenorhabditis elegans]CCD70360.1 Protein containing ALS2cr12 (ALS2CR12) signature [Caenorhabditis elegans]|eukprot:NP_001255986.1 Protein containing ALS2cr12 (ALS2CR12) signature [Caenorhabditis elegans]
MNGCQTSSNDICQECDVSEIGQRSSNCQIASIRANEEILLRAIQLEDQRINDSKKYLFSTHTREVIQKFHKTFEPLDDVLRNLNEIYIKCIPEAGFFPEVKKGVVDGFVEKIADANLSFKNRNPEFEIFVTSCSHADPYALQQTFEYLNKAERFFARDEIQKICDHLVPAVDNYNFHLVVELGKRAKLLHDDLMKHRKDIHNGFHNLILTSHNNFSGLAIQQ